MKSGMVSAIKSKLVSSDSRVRPVLFGLFRGLRFDLNLQYQAQVYFGLWERETFDVIRHASRAAEWFVDIGAGQGELCSFFAMRHGVQRIIAIEPSEIAMASLRANLINNNIDLNRVEALTKFVGTKAAAAEYVEIDQLGISHALRGLIKIDVDGAELDVLQSGKQLFSEGRSDVLVETHSAELERACVEWLRVRGYTCKVIENAWWRFVIPEQRPTPHNRWFFATRAAQEKVVE
jgi:hypothetical protein